MISTKQLIINQILQSSLNICKVTRGNRLIAIMNCALCHDVTISLKFPDVGKYPHCEIFCMGMESNVMMIILLQDGRRVHDINVVLWSLSNDSKKLCIVFSFETWLKIFLKICSHWLLDMECSFHPVNHTILRLKGKFSGSMMYVSEKSHDERIWVATNCCKFLALSFTFYEWWLFVVLCEIFNYFIWP